MKKKAVLKSPRRLLIEDLISHAERIGLGSRKIVEHAKKHGEVLAIWVNTIEKDLESVRKVQLKIWENEAKRRSAEWKEIK